MVQGVINQLNLGDTFYYIASIHFPLLGKCKNPKDLIVIVSISVVPVSIKS